MRVFLFGLIKSDLNDKELSMKKLSVVLPNVFFSKNEFDLFSFLPHLFHVKFIVYIKKFNDFLKDFCREYMFLFTLNFRFYF
jgi:hypothetical protein